MKSLKLYFFILIPLLTLSLLVYFVETRKTSYPRGGELPASESKNIAHYKLKTIFEKDLSKQSNFEYRDFLGSNSVKLIISSPYAFGPTYAEFYHTPRFLYLDQQENIYLLMPGRIEVFDKRGNSILKAYSPDDYGFLDYYSWDDDNVYLFYKKEHFDPETKVYKINIFSQTFKKLGKNELKSLDADLLPPATKVEKSQIDRYISSITDDKDIFYGLAFTPENGLFFRKDDARYVDPINITVLRFDASLKREYYGPLSAMAIETYPEYNKYIFDSINIENVFNEKVVCIGLGNSYVDKKGNIYLDGLKSSEAKRILAPNGRCHTIEVENPIFFLVKFEIN
jgi:hypothetical protein